MGQIDSGWISAFGKYYLLDNSPKSYEDGNTFCGTKGGHIATFKNEEDRNKVQALGGKPKAISTEIK